MPATLALIDYGSGNLRSAQNALVRAAGECARPIEIRLTRDPEVVRKADRVVLPGVGAFRDCRNGLAGIPGMIETLEHVRRWHGRPILGICVGMQLMASWGHENGNIQGLDWIDGHVRALKDRPGGGLGADGRPPKRPLKFPHMGWNTLMIHEDSHPVLANLPHGSEGPHAYFVHSYHFIVGNPLQVLASCDYGGPFTAVAGMDNVIGMQFHPEKSQAVGLALLRNFLEWSP